MTTTGDDLGLEYAPNGSRSCGCKIGICSRDECELVRSFKELTLSGYLPYLEDVVYPLFIHPIMRSCGFRAMRPEVFKVNLNWDHWDFAVLDSISVTNLRILKLPINRRSDCIGLGQMLTAMPRLASLTITDIPDRDEFVNSLEHLGKGILSCASTLRELDIEMTNFNRPAPWDRDERFLEPEEDGFFFRKLFPCSLGDEHSALCERRLRNTTDTMAAASLSLTKLRVKHMSLPWYSFGVIFNAKTIKQLHLPYSMVDEQVWGLLEMYAQLYILTEVSYDMLSAGFLNFLKQQSMLKELTFASPQDQYEGWGFTLYGDSTYLMFHTSNRAPRIGPDAGVGYPSLDQFLSSLENMTMLKHLGLPADMYRITSDCVFSLAASLTGLEHLELGFDYNDLVRAEDFRSRRDLLNADCVFGTGTPAGVCILLPLPRTNPGKDHILSAQATRATRCCAFPCFCCFPRQQRFFYPQALPLYASKAGASPCV